MLKYGTGDFYNPQRTQPSNLLTPYSGINGLDVLCPQVAGTYAIEGVTPNAGIQNILWSSSPNLTLSSTTGLTTTAIFNNSGPSGSLSVNYSLTRQLRQHYIQPSMTVSTPGDTTYTSILSPDSTFVPEQCEITGNKQIQLASSQLWIRHQAEPCEWLFAVWAQPSETGNFNWTISHNGDVIQANGQMVYFMELFEAVYGYGYRNNYGGSYHFLLSYDNGCGGVQTVTATIEIEECEDDIHKYMRITPNPAHTDVNVSVFVKSTNGLIPTDVLDNFNKPGGYPVWIKRTDGGPNLISTRLYVNGGQLDVSSLPTGYYNLQIQLDDTPQPLSQIFIIAK